VKICYGLGQAALFVKHLKTRSEAAGSHACRGNRGPPVKAQQTK
jgi:hypothetical protein